MYGTHCIRLQYYASGIDCTILPAVTHISSRQASATVAGADAMTRFIRCCARYPNNHLLLHVCSMQLEIESDASYFSRPQSSLVADALFYLTPSPTSPVHNGPCLALSSIIPVVSR